MLINVIFFLIIVILWSSCQNYNGYYQYNVGEDMENDIRIAE